MFVCFCDPLGGVWLGGGLAWNFLGSPCHHSTSHLQIYIQNSYPYKEISPLSSETCPPSGKIMWSSRFLSYLTGELKTNQPFLLKYPYKVNVRGSSRIQVHISVYCHSLLPPLGQMLVLVCSHMVFIFGMHNSTTFSTILPLSLLLPVLCLQEGTEMVPFKNHFNIYIYVVCSVIRPNTCSRT